MSSASKHIGTTRVEAFSDGVIAIIITIMIFDLKISGSLHKESLSESLLPLVPKFISYCLSFLTLAIMWVNHHQLFQQIKYANRALLWFSIHLLFWMSLVPFATGIIGDNPMLPVASALYGFIFSMCALSFTLLRNHVLKKNLHHDDSSKSEHIKVRNKNRLAIALYATAAVMSMVSVLISFTLFLVVPVMYFLPNKK